MAEKSSLISSLNPQYFWDIDLSGLDVDSSARLIIERVFSLGEIREMSLLIDFYGRNRVLDVLSNLNYLDPKTLNFVSKLFHKPVKAFKCYQLRQSRPQHWNL
jgi:hypothetical protein